jgi:hypothetical protein
MGDKGDPEWVHYGVGSGIQAPLVRKGGTVYLPKSDAFTNGYLSKEDWSLFRGKTNGLRIWQYQDFEGEVKSPLKITAFENGEGLAFDAGYIVDHSAVIVSHSNVERAPSASGWPAALGGKVTKVAQHVRDTILLDNDPAPNTKCRVYFLVYLPDGVEAPDNYSKAPRYVRNERIELMDAVDINTGNTKGIRGRKSFIDGLDVEGTAAFEKDLEVNGLLKTSSLQIASQPANNYVLTSNSVGDAHWAPSPAVGATPPNNQYDGQLWVRSPEFELYVFDGKRNKWLSVDSKSVIGSKCGKISNEYLDAFGGVSTSANGVVLTDKSTLVGLTVSSEYEQNWIAEIHVNNRLVQKARLALNNKDHAYSTNLNVDLKAGDRVQIFANGQSISDPRVEAIFRKCL